MIYALVHPNTLEIRYIGKTQHSPERRLRGHRADAQRQSQLPIHRWWRKIVALTDHEPCLVRICDGDSAEEVRWIAELKAAGAHLLNCTLGGEGLAGHDFSQQHRDRIAAARRGTHHTLAVKQKIAVASARPRKPLSAEHRAKLSALATGRRLSPERAAALHAAARGSRRTPEQRARLSAACKKAWSTPERKALRASINRQRRKHAAQ